MFVNVKRAGQGATLDHALVLPDSNPSAKSTGTAATHSANLNAPTRSLQRTALEAGRYRLTYQIVQSSAGSTVMSVQSPQRELAVCEPVPLMIEPSPWVIVPSASPANLPVYHELG